MPSVLGRLKELYGKAADAHSPGAMTRISGMRLREKDKLSTCNGAVNVEQWAVNKAVHYNEWENFGRKDFEPVVAAFWELLDCFRCVGCDTWLASITPRICAPDLGHSRVVALRALSKSCCVAGYRLGGSPQ